MCVDNFNGVLGTLTLKWKDPTPNFRMPYYIQVEATEPDKPLWVVRSVADDNRSKTQTVFFGLYGRNPLAMNYTVYYWSSSEGHSPLAQLAGKDIFKSGCRY